MVADNVTDLSLLINQQIESREVLRQYLSKVTALMHVALDNDFLTHPNLIVYFYLWVVADLADHSRELNEQALQVLAQALKKLTHQSVAL